MSIEEKAKAYDEALKKIRPLYEQAKKDDNPIWSTYEHLFSELRESEDERIRKALVWHLKAGEDFVSNGVTKAECLAYLEKQKEHEEGDRTYEAKIYWKGRSDAMKQKEQKHPNGCFTCDEYKKGYEEGRWNGFTAGYNKAMKEVEQKEHKPNYCHHEVDETGWTEEYRKAYYDGWNNCNMQHEQLKSDQKPAEWSDDDEQYLLICKNALSKYQRSDQWDANIISNWLDEKLKSLRPQPQGTYKLIVHNIYEMLKDKDFFDITPSHRVSLLNDIRVRCKNADEQAEILDVPSWKPSEEQIEALETAERWYSDNMGCNSALVSLCEQLKKL